MAEQDLTENVGVAIKRALPDIWAFISALERYLTGVPIFETSGG